MLTCGKYQFDLSRPLVMGIVNVTPDSFSDGGRYLSTSLAVAHAQRLIEEGADILDVGGESTRPGAQQVGEQEEMDRVLPLIEAATGLNVPISIDTYKPAVMRAAITAGASMVNDVNALQEEGALEVVADSNVAVCLMHKQGTPQTMQQQPNYVDVVAEVKTFLQQRAHAAEAVGISHDRIVLDPGFGFGKTLQHNLDLLRRLGGLSTLGYPVLAGLSRKSMLGAITGREIVDRGAVSVAAAMLAVQQGAAIVRVHDVRETVDALTVLRVMSEG